MKGFVNIPGGLQQEDNPHASLPFPALVQLRGCGFCQRFLGFPSGLWVSGEIQPDRHRRFSASLKRNY